MDNVRHHVPVRTGKTRGRLRSRLLTSAFCSVAATVSIFGGISALIAGLFCIVVHSVISGDTVFDHAGTALLILGIPLLLLGSIFLDEIEIGRD